MTIEDGISLLSPFRKTGILGGTFNPIHNGHVDMALAIRQEFSLDRVFLLPSGDPPHKTCEHLATKQQRLHMAELCAFDHSCLSVCDMEIKREGVTYTVDTMAELCLQYPQNDFHFIIGSDTLFDLESWKDFPLLCRMTQFVCVKRDEHDRTRIAAEIARLAREYRAMILPSQYSGLFISSSYIRKRVAEGKSIADFVPAPVEVYIHESRLYK